MKLKKREPSGREKDETSIKLLGQLREKLYSGHVPTARRAAFSLSWMQEDGLDILKEALFGEAPRRTKGAATYGLRKMQGRMKKAALEVLKQGLEDAGGVTKDVCQRALALASKKGREKPGSARTAQRGKLKIREIARRGRRNRKVGRRGTKRASSAR